CAKSASAANNGCNGRIHTIKKRKSFRTTTFYYDLGYLISCKMLILTKESLYTFPSGFRDEVLLNAIPV
ncbi:MAG: hypothetical protein ACT6QZ_06315, partial [Methylophilus sp.]|uniref:hypothetical protein n=1 Tax=Methylophilus sp. TaxID=29541 RepID=UPI004037037F